MLGEWWDLLRWFLSLLWSYLTYLFHRDDEEKSEEE